jgi:excisionase family DNA binding protein
MNRLFTKQEVVSGYNLPPHLQDELWRGVEPVDRDQLGEPLYLESQVDRWLSGRFEQHRVITEGHADQAPMMTIREVAALLQCAYSEARERMLDGRIRAIRDGRWLRTRREWVEEYVTEKTIKPAQSEPEVYTVPKPPRRRQGTIKLKNGGAGYRFLEKLREGDKKTPPRTRS